MYSSTSTRFPWRCRSSRMAAPARADRPAARTGKELGYQDITGQPFTALMAPAGTPAPVIARLNAAMTEILRDPDVVAKIDLIGAEAAAMSPDEVRKYLASEDATWMPVVRKANIKAE